VIALPVEEVAIMVAFLELVDEETERARRA